MYSAYLLILFDKNTCVSFPSCRHCWFNLKLIVFIMHSSYEVFLPSQPYIGPLPEPRGRSSSFLTSIKSLMRNSLSRSRSSRRIQVSVEGRPEREISQTTHDKRKVHPSSPKSLNSHVWRRRRRQIPITSVADYLTLAQLENLWRQQDRPRRDAEIARQPQEQKLVQAISRGWVRQPILSSDTHPAFRSRQISSSEASDATEVCCQDSSAVARYM